MRCATIRNNVDSPSLAVMVLVMLHSWGIFHATSVAQATVIALRRVFLHAKKLRFGTGMLVKLPRSVWPWIAPKLFAVLRNTLFCKKWYVSRHHAILNVFVCVIMRGFVQSGLNPMCAFSKSWIPRFVALTLLVSQKRNVALLRNAWVEVSNVRTLVGPSSHNVSWRLRQMAATISLHMMNTGAQRAQLCIAKNQDIVLYSFVAVLLPVVPRVSKTTTVLRISSAVGFNVHRPKHHRAAWVANEWIVLQKSKPVAVVAQ